MSWFRRHRSESRALTRASAPPLLVSGGDAERLSTDRALGLADVYACARVVAESAAALPLHVYRRAEGGRERASGRVADLLERPAPAVTTSALVGCVVAHLALRGNAFLGKFRDGDGRIEQLGPLDPSRVTVKVENGAPVYELAREAEGITRHGPADILHVRMPLSLDGVLGLGPLASVRHALPLADALATMGRTFAKNAARPSGILKLTSGATVDQAREVKEAFGAAHAMPERSGGIAVVEGDIDWTPLSLSLADAEFVEQRRLSTAEVARIFRVPPWMIGAPAGDSLTYSNTAEQARAFVTFTLRPYLVAIEQAISADRDLCPGGLYAEFVLDGLLRADAKTRAEVYRAALDPALGWMTRAEVRELENLPAEATPPAPAPAAGGGVA